MDLIDNIEKEYNGIIYCYQHNETGRFYVGCTTARSFKTRQRKHLSARSGAKKFSNAIKKYGIDAFSFRILEDGVPNQQTLHYLERYWIKELDSQSNGFNITSGGEVGKQFNHTEETKRKISENSPRIWKGKHLSEETKRKIAQKARENVRPYTEEEAHRHREGIKRAYAEGKRKPIHSQVLMRLDTGEIFQNSVEFLRSIGITCTGSGVRCASRKVTKGTPYIYRRIPLIDLQEGESISNQKRLSLHQESNTLAEKVRTRIRIRCVETQEIYSSINAYTKEYAKMKYSLEYGTPYNGYHWEYVDKKPCKG